VGWGSRRISGLTVLEQDPKGRLFVGGCGRTLAGVVLNHGGRVFSEQMRVLDCLQFLPLNRTCSEVRATPKKNEKIKLLSQVFELTEPKFIFRI